MLRKIKLVCLFCLSCEFDYHHYRWNWIKRIRNLSHFSRFFSLKKISKSCCQHVFQHRKCYSFIQYAPLWWFLNFSGCFKCRWKVGKQKKSKFCFVYLRLPLPLPWLDSFFRFSFFETKIFIFKFRSQINVSWCCCCCCHMGRIKATVLP